MSTDRMTRKQWEERCGKVVTYQLGKPMGWEEFKQIPANLQKEYLLDLIHKYSATASDLARMFDITPQTVTRFCGNQEIGIEFSRGKRMPKECRVEFEKFLSGNDDTANPVTPTFEAASAVQDMRESRLTTGMDMTEFSLCFEGVLIPEMITNSIIAMINPDANVRLEVKCSVLP